MKLSKNSFTRNCIDFINFLRVINSYILLSLPLYAEPATQSFQSIDLTLIILPWCIPWHTNGKPGMM